MKAIKIHDIISLSSEEDWEISEQGKCLKHKTIQGLKISIIIKTASHRKNKFWNKYCSSKKLQRVEYLVQFNDGYFSRYSFIRINEEEVVLPLPRVGTHEISGEQLNLTKILNKGLNFSPYIKLANLEIHASPFI